MGNSLKKQLSEARPKLKRVSPLAHWTVMIMGWFNIIIGGLLFFLLGNKNFTSPLPIVNHLMTFQFWGALFFLLGVVKLYSLKSNNWSLARHTLFVGVSVKAAWAVALTIRTFIAPGAIFLNVVWVTLAALQMGAYIFFLPPDLVGYRADGSEYGTRN